VGFGLIVLFVLFALFARFRARPFRARPFRNAGDSGATPQECASERHVTEKCLHFGSGDGWWVSSEGGG